jgi:hypothetical protein
MINWHIYALVRVCMRHLIIYQSVLIGLVVAPFWNSGGWWGSKRLDIPAQTKVELERLFAKWKPETFSLGPSTLRAASSHQVKTGRGTSGDPHVGRCQATSSSLYSFADCPILQRRKNRRLTKRSILFQKMTQLPAFIKGRVTVCTSRSPLACPPRRTRQVSIKLLGEFHLIVCLPSTMCVRCSVTPAARPKHLPI